MVQKIKEWVLSVQLERRYTKDEIIAMYLNIYDFGYNADGVRSAAKIFFDTTPQSLKLEESATLVGMLKNSSLYNPIRRPEMVKIRRNVVFHQMLRNKLITPEEKDSVLFLRLATCSVRFNLFLHFLHEGTFAHNVKVNISIIILYNDFGCVN